MGQGAPGLHGAHTPPPSQTPPVQIVPGGESPSTGQSAFIPSQISGASHSCAGVAALRRAIEPVRRARGAGAGALLFEVAHPGGGATGGPHRRGSRRVADRRAAAAIEHARFARVGPGARRSGGASDTRACSVAHSARAHEARRLRSIGGTGDRDSVAGLFGVALAGRGAADRTDGHRTGGNAHGIAGRAIGGAQLAAVAGRAGRALDAERDAGAHSVAGPAIHACGSVGGEHVRRARAARSGTDLFDIARVHARAAHRAGGSGAR